MCTLSWLPRRGGYTLFFNRDERLTRALSLPPEVREADGVRFIAPLDGDFGGTWILVNEFGLTLALLNRYGADSTGPRPGIDPLAAAAMPPRVSRGRLVLSLAPAAGLGGIRARVGSLDLSPFQPFTLAAVEPAKPALVVAWNGTELALGQHGDPGMILTSSAFQESEVAATRGACFAAAGRAGLTEDRLAALHQSHLPERGPRSICMHRDDAETQSLSRVSVDEARVMFAYAAEAPCRAALPPPLQLERRGLSCPAPR
jgi:hypothetical protein